VEIRLGGYFDLVQLLEVPLDFLRGHAPGVQGDHHLIEVRKAPLALGNQHRLEAAVPVLGDLELHLLRLRLQPLRALSIPGISPISSFRRMLFVPEVRRHLSFQHPLVQPLRQVLQYSA